MTDLEIWIKLGNSRLSKLAEKMGVSRQNLLYHVKHGNRNTTVELWAEAESIENEETKVLSKCKYNVVKAAQLTNSADQRLASQAQYSLMRWANEYAKFF